MHLHSWTKVLPPLNSVFIQTLLTPSALLAQQQVIAYSKACFLSYKMRYHLNSEAAHLRSRGHGKEKVHVFYTSNFR